MGNYIGPPRVNQGSKKAFSFVNLLDVILDISEEEGVEPVMESTKSLKRMLENFFGTSISFQIEGKRSILYSSGVNPCVYVAAALKGCGLREEDQTCTFAKMVRKS